LGEKIRQSLFGRGLIMTAPLYQDAGIPDKKPDNAHAGLWFDRFFNRYQSDWTLAAEAKSEWIKQVRGPVGEQTQLEHFVKRQTALVSQLNGRSQRYITDWHFVTGMGNSHPVENGFSWHPTLAVPYLAGSAVKGLVRAWVELNDEALNPIDKNARLKSWFGTEKKGDVAEQAGDFIFFDAIPDKCPRLLCDIMTPHMGDWYAKGDKGDADNTKALPADWHEPVPVTFLAVKDAQLIFSIAPRKAEQSGQLDAIFSALSQALEWLGAGAKTAAGYGYMTIDSDFAEEQVKAEQEQAEQKRRNSLSLQQQEIDGLRKNLQDKQRVKVREQIGGALYTDLKKLVDAAAHWPTSDQRDLQLLGVEILDFIGAKSNKKAKELLGHLNTTV
jgi:CRISPR-associated protein Cmr6